MATKPPTRYGWFVTAKCLRVWLSEIHSIQITKGITGVSAYPAQNYMIKTDMSDMSCQMMVYFHP